MFFDRLENYKKLRFDYETSLFQLEELKQERESVQAVNFDNEIKCNRHSDKIASLLAKYENLCQHFNDVSNFVIDEKTYLVKTIEDLISDTLIKNVLLYRYINCLSIDEIEIRLSISPKTIYRYIAKAKVILSSVA